MTESWSPIGAGGDLLADPTIGDVARAHGKTPAQVVLRWHVQLGLIPIPKTSKPKRLEENLDVFDFELGPEEMGRITGPRSPRRGRRRTPTASATEPAPTRATSLATMRPCLVRSGRERSASASSRSPSRCIRRPRRRTSGSICSIAQGRRVRYRRVVDAGPSLGSPTRTTSSRLPRAPADGRGGSGQETEVAYEDLVRGYEVEPETYVFLETEEIERARPTPSRVIDLEHFVRLEEIDPVYFEKAYYVAPGRGAEKSYDLLLRTLAETGRVGIGRFVLRTKPHLVALRPMEGVLALETLFFGDEVRDAAPLVGGLGRNAVTQREIDISKQLVEALAMEWDPSQFADEYREGLMRMIAERTPERIEEEPSVEAGAEHRGPDGRAAAERRAGEGRPRSRSDAVAPASGRERPREARRDEPPTPSRP